MSLIDLVQTGCNSLIRFFTQQIVLAGGGPQCFTISGAIELELHIAQCRTRADLSQSS